MGKSSTKTVVVTEVIPPPGKGVLSVSATKDTTEATASVEVVGVTTKTTPFTLDLDPGTYTLNATYDTEKQSKTATITEGKTTTVQFQFGVPPVPKPIPWLWIIAGAVVVGLILAVVTRK